MLSTILALILLSNPAPIVVQVDLSLNKQSAIASRVVPGVEVKRVLSIGEVSSLVAHDLRAIALNSPDSAPFVRYVWVPGGDREVQAEVNVTANEVWSRNELKVRPVVLYGGHLLRYDLRELAPRAGDLLDLQFLWGDIAADDPYFHLAIDETRVVPIQRTFINGDWYESRHRKLAIPHPEIGPVGEEIVDLAGDVGVVYRADWLIEISNTTVNRGRYYDFRGISKSAPKGKTALDVYLERFALDRSRLDGLKFDERAFLFKSEPTSKLRLIVATRTPNARLSSSLGIFSATLDLSSNQTDTQNDILRNLLNPKIAAYEFIADLPNGTHEYTIFNAAGELLDEGDVGVAIDLREPRTSPRQALIPSLSCRRCHGQEDGWRKFPNDLHKLLKSRGFDTLTIFDDLSSNRLIDETLAAIVRQHAADLNAEPLGPFSLARQHYAATISKLTLGRKVAEVATTLDKIHQRYFVDLVGPKQACREIGFEFQTDHAAARWLSALIARPLPAIDGSSPEDPVIASLMIHDPHGDPADDRQFLPVQRFQFDAVFGDLFARVHSRLAQFSKVTP